MNNEVIIISLLFITFSLINWVYYLYKKNKDFKNAIKPNDKTMATRRKRNLTHSLNSMEV